MKRILPILLVLMALVTVLVSCGPDEVPTTTAGDPVADVPVSSNVPVPTTTKKKLNMGIDKADEGWSFWGDF
ncbi:MAG: hypothetical protein IKJ74_00425 [Clostridia bacterium]|nr:hypothetical protein [Clostridia bacterium]